jgi:hypothetical protein
MKLPEGEQFEPYDEVVAIETSVVYDQCRINKCLYHPDFPTPEPPVPPDPNVDNGEPDDQLIAYFGDWGTPVTGGTFTLYQIRDKQLKILSMSSEEAYCPNREHAKNITVEYKISFWADIKTSEEEYPIRSVKFELTRKDSALLNCPDHNSEISTISCGKEADTCLDQLKIKLIMMLERRGIMFESVQRPDGQGGTYTDYAVKMAICYALLFKSLLNVQLLVPSYGFYEESNPCTQPGLTCPCADYTPLGDEFYPDIDFNAFTPQPPTP